MAEIELNVLTGQWLNKRIDNIEGVRTETSAWNELQEQQKREVRLIGNSQRMPEQNQNAFIRH